MFGERHALDELHDDERLPVVLAEVVNRHDVAVSQIACGLRLLNEPLPDGLVSRSKQLDGNRSSDPRIATTVDDTHATVTETINHFIPADRLRKIHLRHYCEPWDRLETVVPSGGVTITSHGTKGPKTSLY
jgi:hypothetical protein